MKAQTCPVCNGKGKIKENQGSYTTLPEQYNICHGCGGKGWLTVPD